MQSIRLLWMIGLTSPVLYLLIAVIVDRVVFAKRDAAGFWPMADSAYSVLFSILCSLAIVGTALVFLLKRSWAMEPRDQHDRQEEQDVDAGLLGDRMGRRFIVLFMICDTIALLGLILFLIQGKLGVMLVFGVIALLAYAAAHPKPLGRSGGE